MGPLAFTALPAVLGYAGRLAYLGTGSGSIADFGRFPEVLDAAVGDWGQIAANIDAGELRAVGFVATAASSGGSVVFMRSAEGLEPPPQDDKKGIRYVRAELDADHVIASSSIPVFFPPKQIREPTTAAGWYWDGGTRLNTPIRPALSIGVDALVIAGTDPPRHPASHEGEDGAKPDFDDGALHVLQATLNDSVIEDLHSLVRVNEMLSAGGEERLGRRRRYEYLFAGPDRHGILGRDRGGDPSRAVRGTPAGAVGLRDPGPPAGPPGQPAGGAAELPAVRFGLHRAADRAGARGRGGGVGARLAERHVALSFLSSERPSRA